MRALYPQISDTNLVVDPVELGGDGLPGLNCPGCGARSRVFDFLDKNRASKDPRYCHAAFAPSEDLEVLQEKGFHCNKTMVGTRLGSIQTGIPINEAKSAELISFFLAMKNDGVFDREVIRQEPQANCPSYQRVEEEGEALNVRQLSGIWIVSGCFAMAGILVRWLQPKIDKRRKKRFRPVHYYDQMGNKTNILKKDDDNWVKENTIEENGKLIFVGDSRWERMGEKLSKVTPKTLVRALTGLKSGTLRQRKPASDKLGQQSSRAESYRLDSGMNDPSVSCTNLRNVRNDPPQTCEVDTNPSGSENFHENLDSTSCQRTADNIRWHDVLRKSGEASSAVSLMNQETAKADGNSSGKVDPALDVVDRLAGIFYTNDSNV